MGKIISLDASTSCTGYAVFEDDPLVAYGMILSLCAGFRIEPVFVLPSVWRHKLGMFDGTRAGMKRDVMKEKAVHMANELFGLNLQWASPTSTKNDDDVAESILIGYSHVKK